MKYKSLFLLLIFIISLFPADLGRAEEMVQRSLDDAISLMYVSDAILFGDVDQEEASSSSGLLSPVYDGPETDLDNGKLAAMIHAAKMERNDLDKDCEILINRNRAAGKDCEADRIKESCAAKRTAINSRIGKLHKLRGDRRRWGTKTWHFVKRQGRTAWYKLGPSGRRFFHKMGPDLMQMVATGGFSGSAFKTIFKAHLKRTFGKKQISKMVLKGIQRRMMGQMEIAQAAGLDICDPDEDQTQTEPDEATTGDIQSGGLSSIPDGARWKCEDISGILTMLKTMEGPDMTILKHELDFWLAFNKSGPTVHAYFSYDVSENWQALPGKWEVLTRTASAEDKSISIDEFGVFRVKFEIDGQVDGIEKFHRTENFYGLISPENYDTAYVCDVFNTELPTGLHTLSPENFQERCGWNHYYECKLISQ
jgi:hypothetical protein